MPFRISPSHRQRDSATPGTPGEAPPKDCQSRQNPWALLLARCHDWVLWCLVLGLVMGNVLCAFKSSFQDTSEVVFGRSPLLGLYQIPGDNDEPYTDRSLVCVRHSRVYEAEQVDTALVSPSARLTDSMGSSVSGYRVIQRTGLMRSTEVLTPWTDVCNLMPTILPVILDRCRELGSNVTTDHLRLVNGLQSHETWALENTLLVLILPVADNMRRRVATPTARPSLCLRWIKWFERKTEEWLGFATAPGEIWLEDLHTDSPWYSDVFSTLSANSLGITPCLFDLTAGVERNCTSDACVYPGIEYCWGDQLCSIQARTHFTGVIVGNGLRQGLLFVTFQLHQTVYSVYNVYALVLSVTPDVITHDTCSQLVVVDWATKKTTTLIDVADEPEPNYTNNPTTAFNGLFVESLFKKCWSTDGQWIFFGTLLGARRVWKYVNASTKEIKSPTYVEGELVATESVLDSVDGWFLVSLSSPVRPTSVFLVNVDLATGAYKQAPIAVVDQQGKAKYVSSWKVLPVPASVSDVPAEKKPQPEVSEVLQPHLLPLTTSTSDFEASVWLPSSEAPAAGYPVIMDVHGGPHGNLPVEYCAVFEYATALGFAIVSVNYRGSIGYGLRPLESVIGRVGTQDVYDSHYGLLHVIETSDLPLDKTKLHCVGGSHGGSIVSHLISQFPGVYRSAFTRNLVTNFPSQFITSDILDWVLAITGVTRFDGVHTSQALTRQAKEKTLTPLTTEARAAILAKWWQHSPMSNDPCQVTTPVLFGLGGKDRRVPASQGLALRDSFKAFGVETRTLFYPDDNHTLSSLQAYGDLFVNWGLWLTQYN